MNLFIPSATAALAGASLLLAVTAAVAFDRSGSSDVVIEGRKIHHAFKSSYNPADHSLKREGTVTLANGMVFSYSISGTCQPEPKRCEFTGAGKGPAGGAWSGNGTIIRTGDETKLTATLSGPAGRTVKIDRSVEGAAFPDLDF